MLLYTKAYPTGTYAPQTDTLAPNTPTAAALEPRRNNVIDQIGSVLAGAGISVTVDGGGVHVIDTDRNSPLFGTTVPQPNGPLSLPNGGLQQQWWQNPLVLLAGGFAIFLIARKG